MRLWHVLALLILLSGSAFPAFVHGDIYSAGLEKLNKTAIRIDGRFSYQLVTDRSNYSIFLPEGEYAISASTFDEAGNPVLHVEEKVKVGASDQKVDLVLKPVTTIADYLPYLAALILIAIVFVWANRHWETKSGAVESQDVETEEASNPPQTSTLPVELDADAKKVLSILDSMEGRSTQKELGESAGFSDAKLSLILSELESIGKIKKFKRGRGNIIRKL